MVGTNGTARHVGWCTSASYLRQAVSRSSFRPRSVARRCWSDSRTISRNNSSRRHVAAGVRPDQPARATPIQQRHRGTSRRTLRGGSAPQQAVTSLASATTARTNTTRNRPADARTFRGAVAANAQTAASPPRERSSAEPQPTRSRLVQSMSVIGARPRARNAAHSGSSALPCTGARVRPKEDPGRCLGRVIIRRLLPADSRGSAA
jgi:hypothetical protein